MTEQSQVTSKSYNQETVCMSNTSKGGWDTQQKHETTKTQTSKCYFCKTFKQYQISKFYFYKTFKQHEYQLLCYDMWIWNSHLKIKKWTKNGFIFIISLYS